MKQKYFDLLKKVIEIYPKIEIYTGKIKLEDPVEAGILVSCYLDDDIYNLVSEIRNAIQRYWNHDNFSFTYLRDYHFYINQHISDGSIEYIPYIKYQFAYWDFDSKKIPITIKIIILSDEIELMIDNTKLDKDRTEIFRIIKSEIEREFLSDE